ncbi:DUF4148 domain-containing protein [Bordetella genomosp. 1]|uniref:DUF4148 domain-containing protein n=1 Tax=Bordetella genomosp. 1 TaxID=1395607 RepID=A0ABX4F2R5_9BORD|nr:DUF4148 domain-containing protein [Bordetella genomosp. 1]OZI67977.1 hypothetical protein CAL27_00455 [Bordetella genomosp. 1]
MNSLKTLVAAVAVSAAFAGAAQAGELDYPAADTSVSTLTRAQVVADLKLARAEGLVATTEQGDVYAARSTTTQVTRAQVRQELSSARAAGLESTGELDYPPVAG